VTQESDRAVSLRESGRLFHVAAAAQTNERPPRVVSAAVLTCPSLVYFSLSSPLLYLHPSHLAPISLSPPFIFT